MCAPAKSSVSGKQYTQYMAVALKRASMHGPTFYDSFFGQSIRGQGKSKVRPPKYEFKAYRCTVCLYFPSKSKLSSGKLRFLKTTYSNLDGNNLAFKRKCGFSMHEIYHLFFLKFALRNGISHYFYAFAPMTFVSFLYRF